MAAEKIEDDGCQLFIEDDGRDTTGIERKRCQRDRDEHVENVHRQFAFVIPRFSGPSVERAASQANVQGKLEQKT